MAQKKPQAKYEKSDVGAARALGVTPQTFSNWKRYPDFPKKTKRGWNLDKIDKWLQANRLGPYWRDRKGKASRQSIGSNGNGHASEYTLTEANIRKTLEQAENERIKKERQLVEQALELQNILDANEVARLHQQTAGHLVTQLEALPDATDRDIPRDLDPELRDRIINNLSMRIKQILASIEELMRDGR